ncbi:MAG: aminomethyltransferase beta-barrel domain-containing protein, partial [bacterium]
GPIFYIDGKMFVKHRGIQNYTFGQRKGIRIGGGPYYVIEIDRRENKIVIGRSEDLYHRKFSCIEPSFIDGKFIDRSIRAKVKIRYQHQASWATIEPCEAQRLIVTFDEPQRAITPGQAAVLYTEDGIVIGGGTIDAVLE